MSEHTERTNKKVMIIVAHPDDADFMASLIEFELLAEETNNNGSL